MLRERDGRGGERASGRIGERGIRQAADDHVAAVRHAARKPVLSVVQTRARPADPDRLADRVAAVDRLLVRAQAHGEAFRLRDVAEHAVRERAVAGNRHRAVRSLFKPHRGREHEIRARDRGRHDELRTHFHGRLARIGGLLRKRHLAAADERNAARAGQVLRDGHVMAVRVDRAAARVDRHRQPGVCRNERRIVHRSPQRAVVESQRGKRGSLVLHVLHRIGRERSALGDVDEAVLTHAASLVVAETDVTVADKDCTALDVQGSRRFVADQQGAAGAVGAAGLDRHHALASRSASAPDRKIVRRVRHRAAGNLEVRDGTVAVVVVAHVGIAVDHIRAAAVVEPGRHVLARSHCQARARHVAAFLVEFHGAACGCTEAERL